MKTIEVPGPYHFDLVLDRLSLDPLHAVDKKLRSIKVPLIIKSNPIVAEVTGIGTIKEPQFTIAGVEEKYEEIAMKRIKEIFHWEKSLEEIHQHFQKTTLKQLFDAHYGTPIVLDFAPYHCLLKCIVHQQLNLAFAHTLTKRFVTTFGFEKDGVWFYPSPEKVSSLQVEELRELQFSTRKAEYVIGIASEIAEGKLDLDSLREKTDEEIMEELIKLRGVGPWTVQNFLLFGLGRANLFPTKDIGLQNALKKYFGLNEKPSQTEMESMIEDWNPYLSYASLYLWRSIEP
ncbi:DNA-3-methyladenine glycosylase [Bacillus sp. 03113]|uniref:DNA-3-methyladenine glycosylase family protein n=1 Tax=Bacillus sp. 03113 TaxID=2578211 RepID=UPI001143B30B|nr:DNA-3-methyladenine glycosylase [Bacillus sp. 03113]